jgi:light-regulated signal transduction histidine kinase (bacteriophytochrome)
MVERQLLEVVFKTIKDEVRILDAVRDNDNVIVDFKYSLGSRKLNGEQEDLAGKLFLSVYPSGIETGLFQRFVNVVEKNEVLNEIVQYNEGDGARSSHIKAQKFQDGLVVLREDVSISKQAEEKIMQLNRALFSKNRELEALSSELRTFNTIAANDYNDTLKGLYNSMEFIITNDARNLSDAGKANIRRAQAAIQKMKLLTDDIIAFSKIHTDEQMTAVDLNEALAIVISGLDEKIRTEKAIVHSAHLPVISGYAPLISLLFYHLITNALKFRKEEADPVINIKHSAEPGKDIEHSAAVKDASYHMISFIDNGIGFDPKEGEKIFTMFYRLHEKGKQKGSGIGLAICKKIMDLHGGFIASECTPECTTFKCYFPLKS